MTDNKMKTLLQSGCVLVAISTSVVGGTKIEHSQERNYTTAEGQVSEWNTVRIVADPTEHAKAIKVRGAASTDVRKFCAITPFGPVCPGNRAAELLDGIQTARARVEEFNRDARTCRIRFSVIPGVIDSAGDEAVRAVAEEISRLVMELAEYTGEANVEMLRDVCNRAKQISKILLPGPERLALEAAIDAAREVGRELVKFDKKDKNRAEGEVPEALEGMITTAVLAVSRSRVLFDDIVAERDEAIKEATAPVGVRISWESAEAEA